MEDDFMDARMGLSPTMGIDIRMQRPKSELWITPQFRVEFTNPMPSGWQRFWYRFLLGWQWKKL